MARRGDRSAPCSALRRGRPSAPSAGWTSLGGRCWMDTAGTGTAGVPWHGWPLLVAEVAVVTGGRGEPRSPGTPGRTSGRAADAALPSPLFALRCLSWCVNKEGFVIKQRWLRPPGAWRALPRPCQRRWGRACAITGELSALLLAGKWVSSLTLRLPEAARSQTCVPAWMHPLLEWTIRALRRTHLLVKSKATFLRVGRVFWMFLLNGYFLGIIVRLCIEVLTTCSSSGCWWHSVVLLSGKRGLPPVSKHFGSCLRLQI